LGIPAANIMRLVQEDLRKRGGIRGVPVTLTILDDASDTTQAVRNARRFVSEGVVAILGTHGTPASLAMVPVAAEARLPLISFSAGQEIVDPVDEQRFWAFKTPPGDVHVTEAILRDARARGIRTMAYIGFNDAFGEGFARALGRFAPVYGISVVASERYNRTDTSVTGQILRILRSGPDAVLVGGAGTPSVLPHRTLVEKGYRGLIYQTHGFSSTREVLRLGGEYVEGGLAAATAVVVPDQLPDRFPSKKVALDFIVRYEARYGVGTADAFGGYAWDAWLLLARALERALGRVDTGDLAALRRAIRDELEATKGLVGTTGVFNMSPTDHNGLSADDVVIVRVEKGNWKLVRTFR
jgi:branched-chain amino acid transport system substrate-binding protein